MSASNQIATIKRSVRLVDIIRRDVVLNPDGKDFIGCCPFHPEKTPSFRIYSNSERYHCFGCGANGDVIQYLVSSKGMTIPEAKEHLTGDIGIPITALNESVVEMIENKASWFPVMPVPDDAPAMPENILHPQYRLQRPIIHRYLNGHGQLMMCILRYDEAKRDKSLGAPFMPIVYGSDGQWHNKGTPKAGRPIYGLDKLAESNGTIIAVGGEYKRDQLQSKLSNNAIISYCGGDGAIDKSDWQPLLDEVAKGRKTIFWRDNDDAGIKAQNAFAAIFPDTFVLEIPEWKSKGWDCGDAITEEKWTAEELAAFIGQRVLWRDLKPAAVETVTECNQLEAEPEPEKEEIRQLFPKHLYDAPGMVGRLYRWINQTALHPLPELEIGASIGAVGIIYAHKVRTKTDLRSNMYVMGVSPSGSGKDHARKCIKSLLHAAGVKELIGGKPKSGAAILTMAAKNGGRCLLLWDEIGRVLEGISARNSQSYQRDISTNLMELFTSSNTLFLGDELANREGKTNRIDIDQPCFNIYATTVKESLYAAMTSKEAIDGFLSRWLVFEAENPYKGDDEDDEDDLEYNLAPQEELVTEVMEWIKKPTNAYLEDGNMVAINPLVIPYSSGAQDIIKAFQKSIRLKLRNESDTSSAGQSVFAALWARAAEHASKLALCGHEGNDISAEVMQWAVDMAVFCTGKMLREIEENISDNEHEATVKRVLEVIRKNKGISKSALTKKTQWLRDGKHRDLVLDTLLESEQIENIPETTGTDKPRNKYYCK